jgi:hypothetical protein
VYLQSQTVARAVRERVSQSVTGQPLPRRTIHRFRGNSALTARNAACCASATRSITWRSRVPTRPCDDRPRQVRAIPVEYAAEIDDDEFALADRPLARSRMRKRGVRTGSDDRIKRARSTPARRSDASDTRPPHPPPSVPLKLSAVYT